MTTLTAAIILHPGDADVLGECCASLPPEAQIVVVETVESTGWQDRFEFVQGDARSRVYRWTYPRGQFSFARARNKALAVVETAWILAIDADERLLPHQHGDLAWSIENADAEVGGLYLQVAGWCAPIDGEGFGTAAMTRQVRLFRNFPAYRFYGAGHEQVLPSIQVCGHAVLETPIMLHHVGYEASRSTLEAKAIRNLRQLAKDLLLMPASDDRLNRLADTACLLQDIRNL